MLEDAAVPEQVAQEIIIDGRTITHISAGPFDGYLQGPLHMHFLQRGDSPRALRFIGKVLKVALCRGFEPRRGTTSQFSIFF